LQPHADEANGNSVRFSCPHMSVPVSLKNEVMAAGGERL
jgi:hypothetical protein